jgi:DNA-binding IclR family transcriptional regulator
VLVSLAPAADHVLRVLALLARQAEPMPAGAIGAALSLPRSTTYRLLGILADQGFVSYLPEERRYGLGVTSFELGSAYQRQMPLQRIARPILARLVDQTRQNAHLATLHGRDVYYVIEERAVGRPPLVSDVGVRLPATLTASGLAILSRLTAAQLKAVFPTSSALVQRDGLGPAKLGDLRRTLGAVRQRGFALEDGQITVGLSSIGLPVLDHSGHPVAGLSVTFEDARVDEPERRVLLAAIQRAAETLRRRLGG